MLNEPSAKLVESNSGGPGAISTPHRDREPELPVFALSSRWSEGDYSEREAEIFNRNDYALSLPHSLSLPVRSAKQPALTSEYLVTSRPSSHKHSNSHSSTSSCFSSTPSHSHSRISSTSTFCDPYHLDDISDASNMESRPDRTHHLGQYVQQSARDEPNVHIRKSPVVRVGEAFIHGSSRPASPSDALLFPKPLSPRAEHKVHLNHSSSHGGFETGLWSSQLSDQSKTHKRTASEPNPLGGNSYSQLPQYHSGTLQPNTSTSQTRLQTPQQLIMNTRLPSSASSETTPPMYCLYEPNCDTGSTLRKAISHIFGRNKLCTRRIPDPVWVHWCRKHYQRSRYRNVRDYSQRQCELVIEQIIRIRDWSNRNQANNSTMVVRDWTLSMRKREQARIQDETYKKGKKRTHSERHNKPEDDNDDEDDHVLQTGTAVPDWLRDKCSQVYHTEEILSIVDRIRDDVRNGKLDQIPDIEILPNIPMDSTEKLKTPSRRKTSGGHGHKRARSLYDRRPEPTYTSFTHLPPLAEPYSDHHEYGSFQHSRAHSSMSSLAHEGARSPYHSLFRSSHSPVASRSSHNRSVSASINYPSRGLYDSRVTELSSPAFLSPPIA
ncbi:hypothetical protein NPX13_g1209 [Xylaria arbuscula]|uniref:Uncharacterized protein n=1 Tax=Xylaria arbuscula TaxID=114810 RepID=A0A9W8NMH1_9PEZI|nr:hypothetical protein NPX13_g1209 [Xylaria arbuscula]